MHADCLALLTSKRRWSALLPTLGWLALVGRDVDVPTDDNADADERDCSADSPKSKKPNTNQYTTYRYRSVVRRGKSFVIGLTTFSLNTQAMHCY